ncbi:formyltransferase family protein [Winslowiella iniecta]|uniref:formyltransferase family protein n=1 Tax=Winslowiella iniecta TaxID=1560201 RepID=UPI00069EF88F|nr:formyltransferase family protein [Winslowiella iniecta]
MKTCVLITTAREEQANAIYSITNDFFDVKLFSTHGWDNKEVTQELEDTLLSGEVDYLFSFCCPLIVPQYLLDSVRYLCVNFHPSPPEYPGVKGAYRACWDKKNEFGVTAHVMEEKVDTGKILKVNRFPILNNNLPDALTLDSFKYSIDLYQEVIRDIAQNKSFNSNEQWSNFTMTRKKFEALHQERKSNEV